MMIRFMGTRRKLPSREYRSFTSSYSPKEQLEGEDAQEDERLPLEWYRHSYPKLLKMAHALRFYDRVDGRVLRVDDDGGETAVTGDDAVVQDLDDFKTLAKVFICSRPPKISFFRRRRELETMVFDCLTKVCNFLYISAQQRKTVRLDLCRQIAHQHVWRGALEEVLGSLQQEIDFAFSGCSNTKESQMGQQIISCCMKFLKDTGNQLTRDSTPMWAQLWSSSSSKKVEKGSPPELLRWAEVADMFQDLTDCLQQEERLAGHLGKIEAMKEGLYQMKNIVMEREIGYNEARITDSLLRRRLSMSLGHSSKCLFTLLVFYLYGSIWDIEVDACGLQGSVTGGQGVKVCVGKVLTSGDDRMVRRGVKQLDRALGLLKFVWELAKMKGDLDLQGHLWFVGGAEERIFKYRGNEFLLHRLRLVSNPS